MPAPRPAVRRRPDAGCRQSPAPTGGSALDPGAAPARQSLWAYAGGVIPGAFSGATGTGTPTCDPFGAGGAPGAPGSAGGASGGGGGVYGRIDSASVFAAAVSTGVAARPSPTTDHPAFLGGV